MPATMSRSYSFRLEADATCRAVPFARPPRAVIRFRDKIYGIFHALRDCVEQQMELVEILALDIPMRKLHLSLHVDRVCQSGVQEFDQLATIVVRNTDLALNHCGFTRRPGML